MRRLGARVNTSEEHHPSLGLCQKSIVHRLSLGVGMTISNDPQCFVSIVS